MTRFQAFSSLAVAALVATGAIGTAAATTPATPVPATKAASADSPLLIIRFNQKRVYYQHALAQAVKSAEMAKHTVQYHVVSLVPSTSNKMDNEHESAEASSNLNTVVSEMESLGVAGSRIASGTQNATNVSSQEILIFVQ